MHLDFTHTSPRTCDALRAVLQDPDFLSSYAEATAATDVDVQRRTLDGQLVTHLRRTNVFDVPRLLRGSLDGHARIEEITTWADRHEEAAVEEVLVDVGGRRGELVGTSTLAATDGGCTYTADGEFHLHALPRLLRRPAEDAAVAVIRHALARKLTLADSWLPA